MPTELCQTRRRRNTKLKRRHWWRWWWVQCPACGTPFTDYEACCSLQCSSCSTWFCALCFDHGDGSWSRSICHKHVEDCMDHPKTWTTRTSIRCIFGRGTLPCDSTNYMQGIWKRLTPHPLSNAVYYWMMSHSRECAVFQLSLVLLKKVGHLCLLVIGRRLMCD